VEVFDQVAEPRGLLVANIGAGKKGEYVDWLERWYFGSMYFVELIKRLVGPNFRAGFGGNFAL
jgi:hypothetical protein